MSVPIADQSKYPIHPKTLIIWSILSILLLILYGDTLFKWGSDIWNDQNYSHGMLIPLVSLYLIKQRLVQLRKA
jgi:hypothetical protein